MAPIKPINPLRDAFMVIGNGALMGVEDLRKEDEALFLKPKDASRQIGFCPEIKTKVEERSDLSRLPSPESALDDIISGGGGDPIEGLVISEMERVLGTNRAQYSNVLQTALSDPLAANASFADRASRAARIFFEAFHNTRVKVGLIGEVVFANLKVGEAPAAGAAQAITTAIETHLGPMKDDPLVEDALDKLGLASGIADLVELQAGTVATPPTATAEEVLKERNDLIKDIMSVVEAALRMRDPFLIGFQVETRKIEISQDGKNTKVVVPETLADVFYGDVLNLGADDDERAEALTKTIENLLDASEKATLAWEGEHGNHQAPGVRSSLHQALRDYRFQRRNFIASPTTTANRDSLAASEQRLMLATVIAVGTLRPHVVPELAHCYARYPGSVLIAQQSAGKTYSSIAENLAAAELGKQAKPEEIASRADAILETLSKRAGLDSAITLRDLTLGRVSTSRLNQLRPELIDYTPANTPGKVSGEALIRGAVAYGREDEAHGIALTTLDLNVAVSERVTASVNGGAIILNGPTGGVDKGAFLKQSPQVEDVAAPIYLEARVLWNFFTGQSVEFAGGYVDLDAREYIANDLGGFRWWRTSLAPVASGTDMGLRFTYSGEYDRVRLDIDKPETWFNRLGLNFRVGVGPDADPTFLLYKETPDPDNPDDPSEKSVYQGTDLVGLMLQAGLTYHPIKDVTLTAAGTLRLVENAEDGWDVRWMAGLRAAGRYQWFEPSLTLRAYGGNYAELDKSHYVGNLLIRTYFGGADDPKAIDKHPYLELGLGVLYATETGRRVGTAASPDPTACPPIEEDPDGYKACMEAPPTAPSVMAVDVDRVAVESFVRFVYPFAEGKVRIMLDARYDGTGASEDRGFGIDVHDFKVMTILQANPGF